MRDARNTLMTSVTRVSPCYARHTLVTTVTRALYQNLLLQSRSIFVFKTYKPPLLQHNGNIPTPFFQTSKILTLKTPSTHYPILIPNLFQSVLQTPWPTINKLPLSLSDPANKAKPNGSNSRSFNAAVSNLHGMLILTV